MRDTCVVDKLEICLFQRDHCQSYSGWTHKEEVLSIDMKPKKKNKTVQLSLGLFSTSPIPDLLAKAVEQLYAELVKVQP